LLKMLLVMNQFKEGRKSKVGGYQGGIDMNRKLVGGERLPDKETAYGEGAMGQAYFTPVTFAAEGGIMGLAQGGQTKPPRYLDGATDGMADKIDTDIDGQQAAKLSHGEFVIPADVVSHLGNGNSTAGAQVLYKMMDRVRQARTGNKKQGKRIKPEKFMPGGIAGYAEGGAIAFAGETGSVVPPPTPLGTTTESNLSSWAGPYVTDYLSAGQALADKDYVAYDKKLTADTSPLQTQAFTGAGNLQPYSATTFNNQYKTPEEYKSANFNTGLGQVGSVQSYMNPYMQGVVDVAGKEARRQADIDRMSTAGKLAQAGAFGGSRQAIMDAENRRNLQTNLTGIQAKGLESAFNQAQAQRLAESDRSVAAQRAAEESRQYGYGQRMTGAETAARYGMDSLTATEASKQYGAKYGLDALGAQLEAGNRQRAIEQEKLNAQKAQFDTEQAYPYRQIQFQQSLINGLPISTDSNSTNTTNTQDLAKAIADILALSKP
jgi:hypothetical protein